jgi:hypothetical protein
MAYATNGAAIIGTTLVPAAEVRVLRTLVHIGRPAIVPEIGQAMKDAMSDAMSDASIYSLLYRLSEQRRLVARQVVELEVLGTRLRRVVWTPHQDAAHFFEIESHNDFSAQKARQLEPPG